MLVEAILHIAFKAQANPLEWELEKSRFNPLLRELVENMLAKIPKPPPLLSDFDFARLTGGLIRPQVGTLLAEGGKDKDKDPSKR